jgi:putative ABC transport system substrate-binding protein
MSRRRILVVLAGVAACTLGARIVWGAEPAQRVARMGFVMPSSGSVNPRGMSGFWERLRELGWVEGVNLIVERRFAEGHFERLPALMADVIRLNVDVIMTGSTPGGTAAKNATSTIPIVVVGMGDPVRSGLVANLAHPGGNLTGMSTGFGESFSGKWLGLLQETVPRLSTVAMIMNPVNSVAQNLAKDAQAIAPKRHLKVAIIEVRDAQALESAFDQARRQDQAVLVHGDPVTLASRTQITALAAKYRLPAMYNMLEFVDAGGLMAYGPDFPALFQRSADYVDKILRGAKPADLPIEQPTRYMLVVNLKIAKALGLTIPQSILLQADEVIRWVGAILGYPAQSVSSVVPCLRLPHYC